MNSSTAALAFTPGSPFLLGVNYWPSEAAMSMWEADHDDLYRRDLDQMARLGLQVVRIFLLWGALQPEPERVDAVVLSRVVRFCDLAAERGLAVDLTFFTGHMSGPNWAPSWLLDPSAPPMKPPVASGTFYGAASYKNLFTDPSALKSENHLIDEVVSALAGHPAIGLWNLGNEPDIFARPRTSKDGRAWCARHAARIREKDSRQVTIGLHVASLEADIGFRIDQVFQDLDLATMHAYPMYSGWAKHKLDPDFVPFTCRLTADLSGKPTLMEEFGGPTAQPGDASFEWKWTDTRGITHCQFMASETDFADYIEQVLPKLQAQGTVGAMFWCWSDYSPSLFHKPPCSDFRHERHFGLVRHDGSLKPHADVLQRFAAQALVIAPPAQTVLDVSPDAFYAAPREHLARLYQETHG